MTTNPAAAPKIRTQSDLMAAWQRRMMPLGFSAPAVWMMLIQSDGTPLPQLIEFADAVDPHHPGAVGGLAHVLGSVAGGYAGARWAFLRARPGRHGVDADDLAWARLLTVGCREAGVATDVVHLATDDRIVPLPYDALAATA